MKDRGMIKWMPFNSVISNKMLLNSINYEKSKIAKPIVSDEDIKELEEKIIDAYYTKENISITYYQNGFLKEITGKIKKIDKVQKLIYLNNIKLLFSQIIKIKPE